MAAHGRTRSDSSSRSATRCGGAWSTRVSCAIRCTSMASLRRHLGDTLRPYTPATRTPVVTTMTTGRMYRTVFHAIRARGVPALCRRGRARRTTARDWRWTRTDPLVDPRSAPRRCRRRRQSSTATNFINGVPFDERGKQHVLPVNDPIAQAPRRICRCIGAHAREVCELEWRFCSPRGTSSTTRNAVVDYGRLLQKHRMRLGTTHRAKREAVRDRLRFGDRAG